MDRLRAQRSAGMVAMLLTSIFLIGLISPVFALDFSADRIVRNGASEVTAHVNAKSDRWRFEFARPQRGSSVMIVRVDRGTVWVIFSKQRQYAEIPIGKDHRLIASEHMPGEVSRELVGEEVLHGHLAELFEVAVVEGDETRQYYRWVTKAERFPLKTVGKQGQWSEEFRRVMFTEQSPFLFELPRRLDPVDQSTGPSSE